ncbi:hypothetical protein [Kitasatospora mediocidica]|uniref:hypothetical protein n=1 Tax=Kitasatospora mediocidica TaxID=58352 RepID=UPI000569BB94
MAVFSLFVMFVMFVVGRTVEVWPPGRLTVLAGLAGVTAGLLAPGVLAGAGRGCPAGVWR